MTAAARQRRRRARIRDGLRVFRIEASQFDLADALVTAGWLKGWDADDRAKVEAALGRAVAAMLDRDA